ncbi:serine/threonine-protein kinase [Amycolatopsis nalaikhensis]|uniref:non-specific serine/threonine protein kinase n=1 Tax=Amycolatopsis nalaikhensis TaxID=715472 RepID=A0ABY8XKB0_9PSEU|nr:serine/threonine-protein kinase [Amycolatopsis sp. 2-2]WIV56042.1 serine/threonine-protein kinase [Amycolatopsis sp. 2-2]
MENERADGDDPTSPRFSLDASGVTPWASALVAGRYRVGALIGTGATARVHRALDRRLGRAVAIKLYDHRVAAVELLRRTRERTLQAAIDHPRVVALYDSGTDAGRSYLVMQLVDGPNLAEHLLAGPLSADAVTELAVQLADALAHVHAHRVVHRDLKPANVLLGPDGPLISDFGIAHELDATHITGTGLVTGTAAYLAPEQVTGQEAGPAADVYALGLILLECLTAELEYPGTLAESAMARLHRPPRMPDGLPEPLAHTLTLMTALDPADRPTAEEIPRLLRESPAPVVPAQQRRRPLAVTAGLATVAAAAVLGVALARPDVPVDAPAGLPAAQPPATSTTAPTSATPPPASDAVAASSRRADPAPPVAAERPASEGGPAVVKDTGKGKDKGKGKDRGEP